MIRMLRIRPALAAHVAAIRHVGAVTWPATYEDFAGIDYVNENLTKWWSEEYLRAALTESQVLVAETAEGIVGVVEVGSDGNGPVMWKLYVLPEHHGQGIGSKLLEAAVSSLPHGSPPLRTEYVQGNTLTGQWYERKGFRPYRKDERPGGLSTIWMTLATAGEEGRGAPGALDA